MATIEQVQAKLKALTPRNIILVEWGGTSKVPSRFEDKDAGTVFTQCWRDVRTALQQNPNTVFGLKLTELEARARLLTATPRRIKLVKYGGSTKQKSDFVDEDLGVSFTQTLHYVLTNLKRKPGIKFGVPACVVSAQSTLENFGVTSVFALPEVQNKAFVTKQERYTTQELSERARLGVLAKYGVDNVSQLDSVKEKKAATAAAHGFVKLIDGKTMREHAVEKGLSYSCVQSNVKKHGREVVDLLTKEYSCLEALMKTWLLDIPYVHDRKLDSTGTRPDFYLAKQRLIIECDGLYWHSDAEIADPRYHSARRQAALNSGLRTLFFRSDELEARPQACKSVLYNALGMSSRVFARHCTVVECEPSFFGENHLMGAGSGQCFGLMHEGQVVAGMQFKCVNKELREYEISRFCTKNGMSVTGGFSRLLRAATQANDVGKVKTYIDLRYGTGTYLSTLGFTHVGTHLSFKWTNGRESVHRMRFRGNTGYEHGFFKIWDCGQARWELVLN